MINPTLPCIASVLAARRPRASPLQKMVGLTTFLLIVGSACGPMDETADGSNPPTVGSEPDAPSPAIHVQEVVALVEAMRDSAAQLSREDLETEMGVLESLRGDSADPWNLIRLGVLKQRYAIYLRRPSDAEYLEEHPDEFFYNEVAAGWLYTGLHFQQFVEQVLEDPMREVAAYQLTRLSAGGECEGFTSCYIDREFRPVSEFLQRFPDSDLAPEAVDRINVVFQTFLGEILDLREPRREYDPELAKEQLDRYAELAERLPSELRQVAQELIAGLWVRFSELEKARSTYQAILNLSTDPEVEQRIRSRLLALPDRMFELYPTTTVDDRRVHIDWAAPPAVAVDEYVIYRSRVDDLVEEVIARLDGDAERSFTDLTAAPETDYWYVVEAFADESLRSNRAHARTPDSTIRVRSIALDQTSGEVCLLGSLRTGASQALCVSEGDSAFVRHAPVILGLPEGNAQLVHRLDPYLDEVWFVDGSDRDLLRFRKSTPNFDDMLSSSITAGAGWVDMDPAGLPYYGVMVSIDEQEMRILPRSHSGGGLALACSPSFDWCWLGTWEGNFLVYNRSGSDSIPVAFPASDEPEGRNISRIWVHPSGGTAWGRLGRQRLVVEVDTSGAIGRTISPSQTIGGLGAIEIDTRTNTMWVIDGSYGDMELRRQTLEGDTLLVIRDDQLSGLSILNLMALEQSTGSIWVLADGVLSKVTAEGETVFSLSLPE